jgi:hypothetical protein
MVQHRCCGAAGAFAECYKESHRRHLRIRSSTHGALKLNDSVSGKLLAAAVDKRVGGTSIKNVDDFQWGDAEKRHRLLGEPD